MAGLTACTHSRQIDLRWQRHLDQDAVNLGILIELGHQLEQLLLRRVGRQAVQLALDARRLAGLPLVAHVHFAGRIVAHQHCRQAGHDAVVLNELNHLLGQFRADLLGQLLAVEDRGGHGGVESQSSRIKSQKREMKSIWDLALAATPNLYRGAQFRTAVPPPRRVAF